MSTARICLVCSLAALSASPVMAEQLAVRRYATADGLPHNVVQAIHQDAKGYLWFGTNDGLSRFDGYRFVNYDKRHGLAHVYVNDITEDRSGHLWIATNGGGVSRLIDDPREAASLGTPPTQKFRNFTVSGAPGSNRVNAITFDRTGSLWCLTDAGVYRAAIDSTGEPRFESIAPVPAAMYDQMDAFTDARGRPWLGLLSDLLTFDERMVRYRLPAPDTERRRVVSAIVEGRNGKLLVADGYGVFEIVEPSARSETVRWDRLPIILQSSQHIYSMAADARGTLWLGTSAGLISYRDGRQIVYTKRQGLPDDEILAITRDREDNLWLGTARGGLCKLIGESILSVTAEDGLADPWVVKVVEDTSGRLVASTISHGLVEIVGGRAVPLRNSQRPPFNQIRERILRDRWGNWWVGTDHGIFRLTGPELRFPSRQRSPEPGTTALPVAALHEDGAGALWASSKNGGLYVRPVTRDRPGFDRVPGSIAPFVSPIVMTDVSGDLWLGEQGLLGRIRRGKLQTFAARNGLPETDPRAFFNDRRGWLWIGLRFGGVTVVKNPADDDPLFVNYSIASGLGSNTVWSITEDNAGRMYFCTSRGLDRLDVESGRIRHFSVADGLAADYLSHCTIDSRGIIWIGTQWGLTRFDPHTERAIPPAPPTVFSSIRIAGEQLQLPESGGSQLPLLRLPANRNNLSIEYLAVSFHGEQTLRYQYRLDGIDTEWSAATDQRAVSYARLGAGSYRFMVRAINGEGTPSVDPAVFSFRILPPVWQRWWFISLAAAAVLGGGYAAHRRRLARALDLQQVRTRIAADLHDDIGSSLSRIAIQSEVAKRQLVTADDAAGKVLVHIAETARGLVDTMSDIVWSIDPRRDDLATVVARVREFAGEMLDGTGVRWEFTGPSEAKRIAVSPDRRRQLFLILKEAITNIARHSGCTTAAITLTVDDRSLHADIRDDGRGLPRDTAGAPDEGHGTGMGLRNMRARAASIGGILDIKSLPGSGTQLHLEVPLR